MPGRPLTVRHAVVTVLELSVREDLQGEGEFVDAAIVTPGAAQDDAPLLAYHETAGDLSSIPDAEERDLAGLPVPEVVSVICEAGLRNEFGTPHRLAVQDRLPAYAMREGRVGGSDEMADPGPVDERCKELEPCIQLLTPRVGRSHSQNERRGQREGV